jgi:hypothetical protein
MNGKGELWAEIPGYEDRYSISSKGRVLSHKKRNGKNRIVEDRILAIQTNPKGYPRVSLYDAKGGFCSKEVHKIVAQVFIGSRPSHGHCVNHKDGVKINNCVENLEWCTFGENVKHAHRMGLCRYTIPPTAKINMTKANMIREMVKNGSTSILAAKAFDISRASVSRIIKNKSWKVAK